MGYQMEYDLGSIKYTNPSKRKKFYSYFWMVMVLVLCASSAHFIGVFLQNRLSIESAVELMTEDLQNGKTFQDAAEAFCVSIADE